MEYIVNARQMRRADEKMIHDMGIPSLVLMERAALQTVAVMEDEHVDLSRTLIVCGSGNNGGDGFAIARLLWEKGCVPEVVFIGKQESRSEETKTQMEILERMGIQIKDRIDGDRFSAVVDAVFGIGLSREVGGTYAQVLCEMNRCSGTKVAVDIPSGVSADTGLVLGTSFQADLTVTFAYAKIGQMVEPGKTVCGKLFVRPIGIVDQDLSTEHPAYRLETKDLRDRLPKRYADSHKGSYGRLLLIVGSKGMCGAAYLAAKAAYRMGAGLVRILTVEENCMVLQQLLPEAVLTTYQSEEGIGKEALQSLLSWADAIGIGCGLGTKEGAARLLKDVLTWNSKPCLIDADGLNLLSGLSEEWWARLSQGDYVLTPHMKELSRLTGCGVKDLKENRIEKLREFVEKRSATCVMKDSRTLVGKCGEAVFINTTGNEAMAKAGSGDVLAGMIAALMAQGADGYQAAVTGVYLHGMAGDLARKHTGSRGLLAEDLVDGIRQIWMQEDMG